MALTRWESEQDRARTQAAGVDNHLTRPAQCHSASELQRGASPRTHHTVLETP